MPDKQHLAVLKKGVNAWNEWRREHGDIRPNLCLAELRGADLALANLAGADLAGADLAGADLAGADLRGANLFGAALNRARLFGATLNRADLSQADLTGADLAGADLWRANLTVADLTGANLTNATIGYTAFTDVDLSNIKGLGNVLHRGPASIGIDTIYKSHGNIPETFLRGCGVPENFITFMHSLTGEACAFESYSCFVSHGAPDKAFANHLSADLQARGIRTWYVPEEAKWDGPVWGEIDRSIRVYDKLVVVCSEYSLSCGPVLREIERALNREDREHKNVLFPIRIDDYIFAKDGSGHDKWQHPRAADVRAKVIGDFAGWDTNPGAYNYALDKLITYLQAPAVQ